MLLHVPWSACWLLNPDSGSDLVSEYSKASHDDTRACTTMQGSPSLMVPHARKIKKCKQIELLNQKGTQKTESLEEAVETSWKVMQVQQETLQILVATETNHQLQIRAEY